MKILQILLICFTLTMMSSCNGGDASGDNQEGKTAVAHDLDGDGIPDHGPDAHRHDHHGHDHHGHDHHGHDHGKKGKVPHDHDGDGIPDHASGEHGKVSQDPDPDPSHPSNQKGVKGEWVSPEEAEKRNAELQAKQDAAKARGVNAAEKATGTKVCECLNKLAIFKKTKRAQSQAEFDQLAGNAGLEVVKAMQDCHTTHMRSAIANIPDRGDRSVHAFKAREHMDKACLGGNNQLWFYMGKYVSDRMAPNSRN